MKEKLEKIKLLLLDVDGVMTDGRIIYSNDGQETKAFDVKDGHGLKLIQRAGIQVGIITGRESQVVIKRAEDLEDPEAIVASIVGTDLDTIVGYVNWANGPINNVTKTPLVAGQWQKEGDAFDLKIVANSAAPMMPTTADLKLLG